MIVLSPSGSVPLRPLGELDDRNSWAAGKQIDGIPGEWTYPIWVLRAVRFHTPGRMYYEQIHGYDDVLAHLVFYGQLADCGLTTPQVKTVLALYRNVFDAARGKLVLPQQEDDFIGHHAVTLLGARDGGESLAFANSWSQRWGDGGFGTVGRAYFDVNSTETWLLLAGENGHSVPTNFEPFDPSLTKEQMIRAWRSGPVQGTVRLPHDLRLRWYQHPSIFKRSTTTVAEVCDRRHVRLGWCHVDVGLSNGEPAAVITELFVWPHYRRVGLGMQLLEWTRAAARRAGCSMLQIVVRTADIESTNRLPREDIAHAYRLEWHAAPEGSSGVAAIAGENL